MSFNFIFHAKLVNVVFFYLVSKMKVHLMVLLKKTILISLCIMHMVLIYF